MPKAEPKVDYFIVCQTSQTRTFSSVDEARTQAKLYDDKSPECGPHRVIKQTQEDVTDEI